MGIFYNTSIVKDGLVLYLDAANPKSYPGSGSVWYDVSGNGNNASLYNITYSSGYLIFNGTTGYGLVSTNVSPGTGNFTVSAWFLKQEIVNNRYIWDFGSNGGTLSSGTSITSGFRYYNPTMGSSGNLYNSGPAQAIDTWYNIVLTRISGVTYFYRNGTFITSQADTGSIGSWGTSLTLGNYGGGGGYFHYGYYGGISVYSAGLTSDQVSQNFEALRGRYGI